MCLREFQVKLFYLYSLMLQITYSTMGAHVCSRNTEVLVTRFRSQLYPWPQKCLCSPLETLQILHINEQIAGLFTGSSNSSLSTTVIYHISVLFIVTSFNHSNRTFTPWAADLFIQGTVCPCVFNKGHACSTLSVISLEPQKIILFLSLSLCMLAQRSSIYLRQRYMSCSAWEW